MSLSRFIPLVALAATILLDGCSPPASAAPPVSPKVSPPGAASPPSAPSEPRENSQGANSQQAKGEPSDHGNEGKSQNLVGNKYENPVGGLEMPPRLSVAQMQRILPLPQGVPSPATKCTPYVSHATARCAVPEQGARLAYLRKALAQKGLMRDRMLAGLESCAGMPSAVVRALRAELAPLECADSLTVPALRTYEFEKMQPDVRETLVGLTIAARLHRLKTPPPKLKTPFTKAQFTQFLGKRLAPWMIQRARAIDTLSRQAAGLRGYAVGVAAIEAGMADMLLVHHVRSVPLPVELAKDKELRDLYYGTLDDTLGPRKDRGRNATLVALGFLRKAGVLRGPRVTRARRLLSRMYNGSHIDSLDSLLLPPMVERGRPGNLGPQEISRQVVARLPAFYAPLLLPDLDVTNVATLRAALERGLAPSYQQRLVHAKLDPATKRLLARGLFEFGRVYWTRKDFELAAELSAGDTEPEMQFIHALAVALKGGPPHALALMTMPPGRPGKLGPIDLLDSLAGSGTPLAAMAAFDTGLLLEVSLLKPGDRDYWLDIAKRYDRAAKLLKRAERRTAVQRAKAARRIAQNCGAQ